jgi:hypothetical protein
MSVDELLTAVASDLRAIGHVVPESLATDTERADALFAAGAAVRCIDRRIHLRFAARFLACAFEARAEGEREEADRWAAKSAAELELYRAPAPELQPYVTHGGAS